MPPHIWCAVLPACNPPHCFLMLSGFPLDFFFFFLNFKPFHWLLLSGPAFHCCYCGSSNFLFALLFKTGIILYVHKLYSQTVCSVTHRPCKANWVQCDCLFRERKTSKWLAFLSFFFLFSFLNIWASDFKENSVKRDVDRLGAECRTPSMHEQVKPRYYWCIVHG